MLRLTSGVYPCEEPNPSTLTPSPLRSALFSTVDTAFFLAALTKDRRADRIACLNRKQNVQTQASELEALEARIREMEARLKGNGSAPAPQTTIPQRRPVAEINTLSAVDQSQKHGGSRPGTAKASQQAVPGALPPTPTASEGEYEFIPDPYTTSFGPEYPRYRHHHLVPRMTTSGSDANGAGSGSAQSLRSQHYHQQHYQHQHQSTFSNNSPTNQHLNFIINKPQPPDARSIKSVRTIGSENGSADFVIVPGPDGDGEQDRH